MRLETMKLLRFFNSSWDIGYSIALPNKTILANNKILGTAYNDKNIEKVASKKYAESEMFNRCCNIVKYRQR